MAKENNTNVRPNTLGQGTVVKGDMKVTGSLRLDGELIGTIDANERVIIGRTGKVTGKIRCKNIDISGVMEGELRVEELASFSKTARVHGDLYTKQLSIEAGALFTGSCDMGNGLQKTAGKTVEK